MSRELAHEPLGCRPKVLTNTIRRHRCIDCGYGWRHTRRGDKYVTVVIDLTPICEGTGPGRLLDAVAVLDPSHVALLAGKALDEDRCRVQQAMHGHRGRARP